MAQQIYVKNLVAVIYKVIIVKKTENLTLNYCDRINTEP